MSSDEMPKIFAVASAFADAVSLARLATESALSTVTTSKVKSTWSGAMDISASPTTDTDGLTDPSCADAPVARHTNTVRNQKLSLIGKFLLNVCLIRHTPYRSCFSL